MNNYNQTIFKTIIFPLRSFIDNNRLHWIFIVSLCKITKIIDYNRLKMDYNDNNFKQ